MVDWNALVPVLQTIGRSVVSGLAYTLSGYWKYWVEKRKEDADAPFDWKKMGATLLVAVAAGVISGLAQYGTGYDAPYVYDFMVSTGLIYLLRKWSSIIVYGKETVLTAFGRK